MQQIKRFIHWLLIDSETKYALTLDHKILYSTILLVAISIVMVYSSSIAYADYSHKEQYYFLIHHIISIVIGVVCGIIAFNFNTNLWHKYAIAITIFIFCLLVVVLIPHIGHTVNGAKRWIGFAGLGLQPSELSKLAIIIYLSYYLHNRTLYLNNFIQDFGVMLLVVISYIGLLLLEPDMGTATMIFIISLAIFYLADIDKRFLYSIIVSGVVAFILLVITTPYRIKRFLGFMNPWQDPLGKGYQLTHSLLAFGHGGWLGVGFGNSVEKMFYLPEAHTDFILAIIAEETGILGVFIIIILYWIIFYRGFTQIAINTKKLQNREFQVLLAQGISVWFMTQAIINIGVTVGMLPTKGLTLPFISYGGSSIIINSIALAILLKIDYENKKIIRDEIE